LARLLEGAGFAVDVAENGLEAIEKFEKWAPHFIWMDCRMPIMGGIEATRQIRVRRGGTQVKIAAVTASIAQEDALNPATSDFNAILYKPFGSSQIFECMEKLLGVRYVREKMDANPVAASALTVESFSRIPKELLQQLTVAFRKLSQATILDVISQIVPFDSDLARELKNRVQKYDYESIINLLETVTSQGSPSVNSLASTGDGAT
jgi:CheY-like chemotaxis protein